MKDNSTRKNKAYWQAHVNACRSASTMTAYAKQHRIDVNQLYAWKSKLFKSHPPKEVATVADSAAQFEKIEIRKNNNTPRCCKITLPNQICIELPLIDELHELALLINELGQES